MVRIPGMGPKKAATLFKELAISSLDELRTACEANRVEGLKGFGKKTQDKILAGIDLAAAPTSAFTGLTPTKSSKSCSRTCA